MQELGEELLTALGKAGWEIQRNAIWRFNLPPDVQRRHPNLPPEVTAFLGQLENCINAEQNVWFLCESDFACTDPEAFCWNFHELWSLEWAEGDAELQVSIREHWDRHFPFMFSVHSDYDYFALSLAEDSYGVVVHGYAPIFEEVFLVAPSFSEFLRAYTVEVKKEGEREYPYSYFL